MKKIIMLSALSLLVTLPGCVNYFRRNQPACVQTIEAEQPCNQEQANAEPTEDEIIGQLDLGDDEEFTECESAKTIEENNSNTLTGAAWEDAASK